MLEYETGGARNEVNLAPTLTVIPRLGTISPWSSKATEIFRLCGLGSVNRVERGVRWWVSRVDAKDIQTVAPLLFDRMTETAIWFEEFDEQFIGIPTKPLLHIKLGENPVRTLQSSNISLGLAFTHAEIEYLVDLYLRIQREPTDVELMMFAQANSEHCRHKIFNATWTIDNERHDRSLFQSIRNTAEVKQHAGLLSAYADNAAVIEGTTTDVLRVDPTTRTYQSSASHTDILMKVETHNHPTAISPYAGAATGSGGEIRDEGSVGRGSKPKAGLVGYTTSHLRIDGDAQPWEGKLARPTRIASAFEIMRDGPIGAASYNNEFGRPALLGYFRTFEHIQNKRHAWGYHKPVMIAGGVGSIAREHIAPLQRENAEHELLIVLGGPAMLIGLGGGAASSLHTGSSHEDLDFASVQRDNAEMERRCQEVIDRCTALGTKNPIVKIHDVGAGGLSNALPELVNDLGRGANIDLCKVPNADPSMSPMELWCNEAQERYAIALRPEGLDWFEMMCKRERCPFAVVGTTTSTGQLRVSDLHSAELAVAWPMAGLFGKPPKMHRTYTSGTRGGISIVLEDVLINDVVARVLRFPTVASKKFLVMIGDRSITGLVVQEQMVGPHQVPVADAAITSAGFAFEAGEVMTMGERSPIAVLNPAASARVAIAEALTNMVGVKIRSLNDVVLSANWMAAAGFENEDQALRDSVRAVGEEFCPALGIAIPVGKDSLSMSTQWDDGVVTSPVTLIVSAFAPVPNVYSFVTPAFQAADSQLLLLSLSDQQRLGGSVVVQTYSQLGDVPPDVEDPQLFKRLFGFVQRHVADGAVLSVHDRSDGGLFTTVIEQAIASRIGVELRISEPWLPFLFNEEIGVVVEIRTAELEQMQQEATRLGLTTNHIGNTNASDLFTILDSNGVLFEFSRMDLELLWSQTSFEMQRRRDNSTCADQERQLIGTGDAGLAEQLTFDPERAPYISTVKPLVAVLRDQGVNGHLEMAAAFRAAGFEAIDVHMTDLLEGRDSLDRFRVMVACGGFSYGDVLGGGGGWAKSILYSTRVRDMFEGFFTRDTLTLGICNGCQMLAQLRELIPGADQWVTWAPNLSGRFEGRTVQVQINDVDTPWLADMAGSQIPVPVAHGEGRAIGLSADQASQLIADKLVALQYVDGAGQVTEQYPLNPNGSVEGIAGLVSSTGKALITMPHPERVFRAMQQTWRHPSSRRLQQFSGWARLFQNAFRAVGA